MLANDDNVGAIQHNITKASCKWQMLSPILLREGAQPKVLRIFYNANIQSVLLYGSKTWVLTKEKYQLLNTFHTTAARRISWLEFCLNPTTEIW
jgi:hypothetical protein